MKKSLYAFGVIAAAAALSLTQSGGAIAKETTNAATVGDENKDPKTNKSTVSQADKDFVKDAALGSMTEVKLGKLATTKSKNNDVKSFGQKMVEDHGKLGESLTKTLKGKGINVPAQLDKDHQSTYDKFNKMDANSFDKAYIDQMIDDHKKDVSLFDKEANEGSDPDLKSFASTNLPMLKEHLTTAQNIRDKMDNMKPSSGGTEGPSSK